MLHMYGVSLKQATLILCPCIYVNVTNIGHDITETGKLYDVSSSSSSSSSSSISSSSISMFYSINEMSTTYVLYKHKYMKKINTNRNMHV